MFELLELMEQENHSESMIYKQENKHLYNSFIIGIDEKIEHPEGTQRHRGVLCFAENAVQKCICWSLFMQKETNLNDSK